MKRTMVLAILATTALSTLAQKNTYVRPHYRSDGTYVEGHYRTRPDSTVDNNFSTRGNFNPYTGEQGTRPLSFERPIGGHSLGPSLLGGDQNCDSMGIGIHRCR